MSGTRGAIQVGPSGCPLQPYLGARPWCPVPLCVPRKRVSSEAGLGRPACCRWRGQAHLPAIGAPDGPFWQAGVMSELRFFQRMQEAMNNQAADTWDMVQHSRSKGYRLRLGEVTATEHNFFRLRDYWTKRVYIVTNEPDESATGADWEWLIGRGDSWIQIRVQAKILNRHGGFSELGHPGSTGLQMDRLINPPPDEVTCRWLPLYVFYAADPVAGHPVPNNAGCSAQLATHVRDTYNKPPKTRATLTSKAHLPGSIPWAGIFDGLVEHLKSGLSLSDIVTNLAGLRMPSNPNHISDLWDMNISAGTCDRNLPTYVERIVGRENDDFDSAPLARLDVEASPRPGIAGPVVRPVADDQVRRGAGVFDEIRMPARLRRRDDEDSSSLLPARSLVLDSVQTEPERLSLPSFVSVIDIDRLPDIPEQ